MRNNLKKILLLLITLVLLSPAGIAQRAGDNRTHSTKIADVLAQLPAEDTEKLNASMNDIAELGREGLIEMTKLLSAPGEGDNTQLEYALGGFSFFAMQEGKEDLRKMSVDAYCQALQIAGNEGNKDFIIRQLQVVGKDDAVSCLQSYLNSDKYCAAAASALIHINSSNADKALLQALQNSQGSCRLTLVQALGDTKNKEAVAVITPYAKNEEGKLRKLALYALANIADPASERVLAEAALEDDFIFDNDNATAAYLLYAQRLQEDGRQKQAEKISKSLLRKTRRDNQQVQTRTAALKLLTRRNGEKSIKQLINAAGDANPEYRAAALKFAGAHINPSTITKWVRKAGRSKPEIEAEIITMLGMNNAEGAMPFIIKSLKSKNIEVRKAAIGAVGRMGGERQLPHLLEVLKNSNKAEVNSIREALLIMDSQGLPDQIADALPEMSPDAQTALISVLGNRASSNRVNDVFAYVNSNNEEIRMAALIALERMVAENNLSRLFSFLNETSHPEEVRAVQEAITAAMSNNENQTQKASLVLQEMKKAPADKQVHYFSLLANIGGEQSLNTVSSAFNTGNATTKEAAVTALSAWTDAGAANELYRIGKDASRGEFRDQALEGYVRTIRQSDEPDQQKLLMFRRAMDIADKTEHKKLILREVGRNSIYTALTFAGDYLNVPALQQEAAHAVMRITLSQEFHGEKVRELLNKTIQVLEGPDSEYEKENMRKFISEMPEGEGFVQLFNGEDLKGWKGLVANPLERAKMNERTLSQRQERANEEMRNGWKVENGELTFTGEGNNIATEKKYGDFEMLVDWKIYDEGHQDGDAGIYLRGTPQVQIWDISRVKDGAQVGSGGLYNNEVNPSDPLLVADNPLGEWNTFRILMKGDRVTVYLNGELVTDNVILENFWDRSLKIFPEEQIELQAHGSRIGYRDIYIREIPRQEPFKLSAEEEKEGFDVLFNGTNMYKWTGNTKDYVIEDGVLVVREPEFGSGGNLFTKEEYSDFVLRFEFKLTPGANNGLGVRAPLEGDVAYEGMEIQILDNDADIYKNLEEYQFHGSVYGVLQAERGYLKPVGEWNYQEVIVNGPKIKVILNGTTILDGDISDARKNRTLDGKDHPGLKRDKGHIGFLGHGSTVWFRNIRVKDL